MIEVANRIIFNVTSQSPGVESMKLFTEALMKMGVFTSWRIRSAPSAWCACAWKALSTRPGQARKLGVKYYGG